MKFIIPPKTPRYPEWTHEQFNATRRTQLADQAFALHGNDLQTSVYRCCLDGLDGPHGLQFLGRVSVPPDQVMASLPSYLMRMILDEKGLP